jgi:hypothetical protein
MTDEINVEALPCLFYSKHSLGVSTAAASCRAPADGATACDTRRNRQVSTHPALKLKAFIDK